MSDHIVTFKLRETPSNESSSVLIDHRLHITKQSRSGNDVTWSIDKLTFRQTGGDKWHKNDPGLDDWVVTHADPDNPVASDFTSPSRMEGTADNDDVGGTDLDYTFMLGSCSGSEGSMYGGNVTCTEYSYKKGATTIAEEEEDEPAETDFVNDPS